MTVVRACFHAISFSLRAARLARARSPRCVRLKSGGCSYATGFRLPSRRKASPQNRLAVRRAGLALMRAMCRKRCEELLAVRMPAEPKKPVVRFSEREPSRFQIIPGEADHVPYHGS